MLFRMPKAKILTRALKNFFLKSEIVDNKISYFLQMVDVLKVMLVKLTTLLLWLVLEVNLVKHKLCDWCSVQFVR